MLSKPHLVKILDSRLEHSDFWMTNHQMTKLKQSAVNFTWTRLMRHLRNKLPIALVTVKANVQVSLLKLENLKTLIINPFSPRIWPME